ncbi:MAG TPA: hypothetical protein VFB58_14935 [Chloroflexota bacterium]|nr:hypothetical protein [Chloroflexota bacterium]
MEDWQEWQIRAEQVAAELGQALDGLEAEYFGEATTTNFRAFWPRFRELKENVRVAPAIKLEDKLALERRLRGMGSRAYKAQEVAFSSSAERRSTIGPRLEAIREAVEGASSPREIRSLRRELGAIRKDFEADETLVAADRQGLWDEWRQTNQLVWDRLNAQWEANATILRDILTAARQDLERGNANGVRQSTRRFFEALRTHEAKQETMTAMKAEADELRRSADEIEEKKAAARQTSMAASIPATRPVESWRSDLEKGRESVARLTHEASELERRIESADSILEQAMIRGNLVEKRRKIGELERANRDLEHRIEQSEDSPLIPTA